MFRCVLSMSSYGIQLSAKAPAEYVTVKGPLEAKACSTHDDFNGAFPRLQSPISRLDPREEQILQGNAVLHIGHAFHQPIKH